MRAKGTLNAENARQPDEVTREIARCDAAMMP